MVDALRYSRARETADDMGELASGTYSPFNLYVADGDRSYVTSQRVDEIETRELEPGAHVLCNHDLDDLEVPKVARLHRELGRLEWSRPLEHLMEGLASILSSHAAPGRELDATCIHTEGYGTRSSAILALGTDRWRYWYADGAPCTAKYRNLTTLLDDLR